MEEVSKKTIKIARTRTGVPCLWESLVNFSDLKRSTVILCKDGHAKNAVFLNEDREKQALVPIEIGDYISKSFQDQHGIAISLFKIMEISPMGNEAVILPVFRKSSLVNEYEVPTEYTEMVDTSIKKLQGDCSVVSRLKGAEKIAI
jgi:hypothetical protein